MSVPTFYLDEDSSHKGLVRALRLAQVDVQTAADAGLRSALDPEHVSHVLRTGRILVTGDHHLRDRLVEITRRGDHHLGCLFLPKERRGEIGSIVFTFELIQAACLAEEMVDRVEFIPY